MKGENEGHAGARRTSALLPLAALIVALAAAPADARAQGTPQPCSAEEYGQFDFWLGEWEVKTQDGQFAGTNTISKIHGGCVLREEWVSASGGSGESFNMYDRARDT